MLILHVSLHHVRTVYLVVHKRMLKTLTWAKTIVNTRDLDTDKHTPYAHHDRSKSFCLILFFTNWIQMHTYIHVLYAWWL